MLRCEIPTVKKPYIPKDGLRKNPSNGNVIGLVFNQPLDSRNSMTKREAQDELAVFAKSKHCDGDRPYYSVIEDVFKCGAVSIQFAEWMLGLDTERIKKNPRPELEGVTNNRTGPTPRRRYLVTPRFGEDNLIVIDIVSKRMSKQSVEVFKKYIAQNPHVKSRVARRVPSPCDKEETTNAS